MQGTQKEDSGNVGNKKKTELIWMNIRSESSDQQRREHLVIEVYPGKGGSKLKSSSDPDSRSLPNKVESDELNAPISEVIIV